MNKDTRMIIQRLERLSTQIRDLEDCRLPQYLSPKTVAFVLDTTEKSVRSILRNRDIPYYKAGRRVRILLDDLEKYLIRHPSMDEMVRETLGE